jgi:nucleotide-binding universal stress UspA family protein
LGNPDNDIVAYSKILKPDLIVIGSRGLGGVKEAFLGSVSNHVMHKSLMPVLIVK